MRKILITIFAILLIPYITNSQNIEKIEVLRQKITRFEQEIQLKSDSLIDAKNELQRLISINVSNSKIYTTAIMNCQVRKYDSPLSEVVFSLNINDSILVIGYKSLYFIVEKNNLIGYVFHSRINESSDEMIEFKKQMISDEKMRIDIIRNTYKNKYFEALKGTYGEDNAFRIIRKRYWIGMTAGMAIESLGQPEDINKTVNSINVHEQWIYKNDIYLYFDNGILTSFQN